MSKELKPEWYMFQHEETGQMQPVEAQQVEWGFEELNPRLQNVGALYTQSQLDALSAYIEELKKTLRHHLEILKDHEGIIDDEAEALLNQSPTTSLEQVKREAAISAINGLIEQETSVARMYNGNKRSMIFTADAGRYVNNLKEKG